MRHCTTHDKRRRRLAGGLVLRSPHGLHRHIAVNTSTLISRKSGNSLGLVSTGSTMFGANVWASDTGSSYMPTNLLRGALKSNTRNNSATGRRRRRRWRKQGQVMGNRDNIWP